jgi:hypothetical protein
VWSVPFQCASIAPLPPILTSHGHIRSPLGLCIVASCYHCDFISPLSRAKKNVSAQPKNRHTFWWCKKARAPDSTANQTDMYYHVQQVPTYRRHVSRSTPRTTPPIAGLDVEPRGSRLSAMPQHPTSLPHPTPSAAPTSTPHGVACARLDFRPLS